MASANPPASGLTFNGDQAKSLVTLERAAQLLGAVLVVLAVAKLVTSALGFGNAAGVAVLGVFEGLVTILLALILFKIATDLRYAREVPQFSGVHLANALGSWRDFCKTLIALGMVAFLTAALRFGA
jgi:hypothetical protein